MRTVPIVFAFDNNLVFPATICISSLLLSAAKETFYHIYILHGSDVTLDATDFKRLEAHHGNCKIEFRAVPPGLFKDCYEVRGITIATYYRLMIPEIIPEYDKIVYSDVDVIFREDQGKYFDIELPDNIYVAGVNCAAFLDKPVAERRTEEMQRSSPGFIYAGNIVLNSKAIREQNITDLFLEEVKKKHHLQDMEVLNRACKGHILRLPPAFCLTPRLERMMQRRRSELGDIFSAEEIQEAFTNGTVHYAGPKPWNTSLCLDADVWWHAYRESIFFDPAVTYNHGEKQFTWWDNLSLKKRLGLLFRYFTKG